MEIAVSKNSTGDDAVYQLLSEKDSTCTISVDENIEAVVVVELDPAVESAVITTSVASHADLTLVCVQSPLAVHQTISQANTVQEGAKLQCQNITLGSHVEHAVVSHLRGDHATSSVDWISYAHKKETQNISAENVFCAANGGGEINMKSVAEDTAHLQCN